MVGHIIAALRRSRLVKDIDIVEVVEEESIQFLRVKHEGGSIDPSMRISIEEVLADIAAKLKES